MKLLALDTASAQCSVALLIDHELLIRELPTARDHAQLILPMIDSVLAEAGLTLRQLQGIAFGRGPGSFTGVRVAAAVTQGLAAGADLPVLPVSDLRALGQQALRRMRTAGHESPAGSVLACMDARMGEVYWAAYATHAGQLGASLTAECVAPAVDLVAQCPQPCVAASGRGLGAWPQIAALLQIAAATQFADAEPHAQDVARLAVADLAAGAAWLDAAQAQPVYVRNQVATAKTQG
ncbi:MAG: tRNA (adenosine(37)-N6)-threonylcarbamoyltransferase complex dimerization subunit type 1 TsaB [Steroidobacteraceae bacterium]